MNRHARAATGLTLQVHHPAKLFDDAFGNRQAQAGAVCFGRKKWLHGFLQHLGRHAGAVIFNQKIEQAAHFLQIRAQNDFTSRGRSGNRIQQQIQHDLAKPGFIGPHGNGAVGQLETKMNFLLARGGGENVDDRMHRRGEIERGDLFRHAAGQTEVVVDDLVEAIHFLFQHVNKFAIGAVRRNVILQNLDRAANRAQRIPHLVRQARGQLTHDGQALRVAQLLLNLAQVLRLLLQLLIRLL